MSDGLEILKASVPFATLMGVVVGAFLNSKLTRKEKIRDHLFSYKVKSYATLAECIVGVKRDVQDLRSSIRQQKESESKKKMSNIWDDFRKVSDEQALFLSDITKHDLSMLEHHIFIAYSKDVLRMMSKESFDDKEMMDLCDEVSKNCEKFISKLQDELGLNIVNKKLFNLTK